jgi:excisionase family DNA binding protein
LSKKTKSQPDPILVNTTEAGRLLGISQWTVYQLIGEKKLEAVKQGRRTYIPYTSLKAYAAGLHAPTTYRPREPKAEAQHG